LSDRPVLRAGADGDPVRELQRRLGALGFAVPIDERGRFGSATEAEVRAFQEQRALRVDGVCGAETWSALVESEFHLGGRMLYVRRPMLRGDDVSELQHRLNGLGFDAGKEDGIFGPDTQAALTEFQRNAGIAADGIFGPDTAAALGRMSGPRAGTPTEGSVASVREREELRRGEYRLDRCKIFVAVAAPLDAVGAQVHRALAGGGAEIELDITGTDDSSLAAAANQFGADLFLGIRPGREPESRCSYYSSGRFRSEVGFRVATAVGSELGAVLHTDVAVCGLAHAVLRETRMAAVVCEPVAATDGDAGLLAASADEMAAAIERGVRRGLEEPADPR
jgi:N-acetylmuramoyl-L-alanine amidase